MRAAKIFGLFWLVGCAEAAPRPALDLHSASVSVLDGRSQWAGSNNRFVRYLTAQMVSPESVDFELVVLRNGAEMSRAPMARRPGLYDYDGQVSIDAPGAYRLEVRVGESLVGADSFQVVRIHRLDGSARLLLQYAEPLRLAGSEVLVDRPTPQDIDAAWRVEWRRGDGAPIVTTGRDNALSELSRIVEAATSDYHLKERGGWRWRQDESYPVPPPVRSQPDGWRVRIDRQGVAPLGGRIEGGKLVPTEVPAATPAIARELAAVKPLPAPLRSRFANPVRCTPAEVRALVRSAEVRAARMALNAEAAKAAPGGGAMISEPCSPAMSRVQCLDHERKMEAQRAALVPAITREHEAHLAKAKQLGVPYLPLVARVGAAPWRDDEIP